MFMRKKNTPIPLRFIMKVKDDPNEGHQLGTSINGDPSIWQQWVTHSFAINKKFPLQFLLPNIQWLGMLDANIRQWEARNLDDPSAPKEASERAIMELSYWYFLSYLWVLSAYEVVRTLSQKANERPKPNEKRIFGKQINRKIVEMRDALAEARIPLSKLESRKTKGHTAIAFPVIFPGDGFGWRISSDESKPGKEISRRELADAMLDLLKSINDNKSMLESS